MFLKGEKLKISAIVVGYNEIKQLEGCLKSISFCDEIIYFDLGSTDGSTNLAEKYCTKIIQHEKVPGCEWIHAKYYKSTKYDWILIIDPDEVISNKLSLEIISIFNKNTNLDCTAAIEVPEKYYFRDQILIGTPWGIDKFRILIVNKNRFLFLPLVHLGRKVLNGYETFRINLNGDNFVHHFWMTSFFQLYQKHKRYLLNEGKSRFEAGQRVNIKLILYSPFKQFLVSFILMKGYKNLFIGLFLSLFWAWYQTSAAIRLYRIQKEQI
jgi:glycosyltransferase involved in cell wall biosynthesis